MAPEYRDQIPALPGYFLVCPTPRKPTCKVERDIVVYVNIVIAQAQISAEINQ